jgi:hypothetical protein
MDDLWYQLSVLGRILRQNDCWIDGIVGAIFEEQADQEPGPVQQDPHDHDHAKNEEDGTAARRARPDRHVDDGRRSGSTVDVIAEGARRQPTKK